MAVIEKLIINQFRNIENQYIEPKKGINLVIGSNAQGKTNLLESIYYLGHNRSFKTTKLSEIIGYKKNSLDLSAIVDEKKITLKKTTNKTKINIDNTTVASSSKLTKLLPIQIITPDKGFVINGTPKNKRSYLDWGLFHVKPELLQTYKTYNKTLKNINSLLNKNQTNDLEYWYLELTKTARIINENRDKYVKNLTKITQSLNDKYLKKIVNNTEKFEYSLFTGWPKEVGDLNEANIYKYLIKQTNNFARLKFLSCGAHKASIKFYLNNKNESLLSRGQQKKYSLIFWLSQIELLVQQGVHPIVLIDDISSELDKDKTKTIMSCLELLNIQAFITDISSNTSAHQNPKQTTFLIDNGTIKTHNSLPIN